MSGWGLRAMVLIHLDAHAGTWCPLSWLAGRILVSQAEVRATCELLERARLLRATTSGGEPCYGVRVTDESTVLEEPKP